RTRRDRRGTDHRRWREAGRGLLGAARRRRHRELVRLRARARVPAGSATGTLRRKNHRARVSPLISRRLHRDSPPGVGWAGMPRAPPLANPGGGDGRRATVSTTLTTRVAGGTPAHPTPRGASPVSWVNRSPSRVLGGFGCLRYARGVATRAWCARAVLVR